MRYIIPESIVTEHEELHEELVKLAKGSGRSGEQAKTVANLLHPHFVKEEEFALPPLGLLGAVAVGRVTPEMAGVLPMTDKLKAEIQQMLQEHKAIVAVLEDMAEAAKKKEKMEYVHFAEKLILHAHSEEEILYPASLLVGEYIRLKLKK